MVNNVNLKESVQKDIDKAIKRYSSLFTMPSFRSISIILLLICLFAGLITPLHSMFTLEKIFNRILLGLTYYVVVMAWNTLLKEALYKREPLLTLRRLSALSIFSVGVWTLFLLLGVSLTYLLKSDHLWMKILFIGVTAASILNILTLIVLSLNEEKKCVITAHFIPFSITAISVARSNMENLALNLVTYGVISVAASISSALIYLRHVDRVGERYVGFSSLRLLRAFLADWMESLNSPLEEILESIGHLENVKVALINFYSKGKIRASLVVPAIHPGPFKNVGSSSLPHLIIEALEKKFGCVGIVVHGVSGHGLDLTSQNQVNRVLTEITNLKPNPNVVGYITPSVSVEVNEAKAKCIAFDGYALITLTMAPKAMEDLPPRLSEEINEEAKKRGFREAILVDAHNSINGNFNLEEHLATLKEAALRALDEALKQPKYRFEVGAYRIEPKEFGLKQGMGPGGIGALAIKIRERKFMLISIDGNNMISGLREDILSALSSIGIRDCEVVTTDTHVVNGIVLTRRGWHPIGEALDNKLLVKYVVEVAERALLNCEECTVSCDILEIPNVKVIGEEQIRSLTISINDIAKKAKKYALIIFPILGLLLSSAIAVL